MTLRNRSSFPLASAIAILALAGCGQPSEQAHSDPPKTVKASLLTVSEATVPGTYVATGTIKARLNATLSSKVMGRVVSVSVREGDAIKQGQLLVSLDSRELESAVNMAGASYHSSVVAVDNAKTAAEMEAQTSRARIAQAESQVVQAQAALSAAEAKRDLALAGPRTQEVTQSHLAVIQAESSLKLATVELDRANRLLAEGAIAQRDQDLAKNRFDLAKGQYDFAVQGEAIAREGSRSQDIRAAQEAVSQAKAGLSQARSGVLQAKAAAMQAEVRRKEVDAARAQVQQSAAAVQSAQVGLSYARVVAPFDGRVVQRFVDPGSMASPGVSLLGVEGGEYRLEASVPERILASVSVGQTAQVTVDALGGKAIEGRVAEIVPQADAGSHSFLVRVTLPNTAGIKSGMFGKMSLRTGSQKQIRIPETATWEREGLHYVFALDKDGLARLRMVTLGERTDGKVEILSGLSPSDRIVVGNRDAITDGNKVEAN